MCANGIASVLSVLTPLVAPVVGLIGVWLGAKITSRNITKLQMIQRIDERLAGFYEPMLLLLSLNKSIYESFGLNPDDSNDAGLVWEKVRETAIIPNNAAILSLIRDKAPLMAKGDDPSAYLPLAKHIASYAIYVEKANQSHKKFKYPQGIIEHLQQVRNALVNQKVSLEGKG